MHALEKPNFIYRQNLLRQFFMEREDNNRASNAAEPKVPLRREADTTDVMKPKSFACKLSPIVVNNIPPSPRTIQMKPRMYSVATQTWPSLKPIMAAVRAHKKSTTPNEKPKTEKEISKETVSDLTKYKCKRSHSEVMDSEGTKSVLTKDKRSKSDYKDSERTKSKINKIIRTTPISFITSKSGRFDRATAKRSESPVYLTNAAPSRPFQ